MEVYISKTLKTSNLQLKLKNLKRSCDEPDARIKVFWTYYCLTSVEHAVEIGVKMYGCTVSCRMETVLSYAVL
jgi:hypothetical protein